MTHKLQIEKPTYRKGNTAVSVGAGTDGSAAYLSLEFFNSFVQIRTKGSNTICDGSIEIECRDLDTVLSLIEALKRGLYLLDEGVGNRVPAHLLATDYKEVEL